MPLPEGGFKRRGLPVPDRGPAVHAVAPTVFQLGLAGSAPKGSLGLAAMGAEIHLASGRKRASTVQAHRRLAVGLGGLRGRWSLFQGKLVILRQQRVSVGGVECGTERLLRGRHRGGLGRRVRGVWVRRQSLRNGGSGQPHQRVSMGAKQGEVRVGAGELAPQPSLELRWVGAGETGLAGAEPKQQDFVVLRARQAQGAAVGPVGQDVSLNLSHLQLLIESPRIGGGKIGHKLAKELLEIAHET